MPLDHQTVYLCHTQLECNFTRVCSHDSITALNLWVLVPPEKIAVYTRYLQNGQEDGNYSVSFYIDHNWKTLSLQWTWNEFRLMCTNLYMVKWFLLQCFWEFVCWVLGLFWFGFGFCGGFHWLVWGFLSVCVVLGGFNVSILL